MHMNSREGLSHKCSRGYVESAGAIVLYLHLEPGTAASRMPTKSWVLAHIRSKQTRPPSRLPKAFTSV